MGKVASMFTPKMPTPEPVRRMPDANSPAAKLAEEEARRRAMASGRRATDLTGRAAQTGTAPVASQTKLGM